MQLACSWLAPSLTPRAVSQALESVSTYQPTRAHGSWPPTKALGRITVGQSHIWYATIDYESIHDYHCHHCQLACAPSVRLQTTECRPQTSDLTDSPPQGQSQTRTRMHGTWRASMAAAQWPHPLCQPPTSRETCYASHSFVQTTCWPTYLLSMPIHTHYKRPFHGGDAILLSHPPDKVDPTSPLPSHLLFSLSIWHQHLTKSLSLSVCVGARSSLAPPEPLSLFPGPVSPPRTPPLLPSRTQYSPISTPDRNPNAQTSSSPLQWYPAFRTCTLSIAYP